MKKYLILLLTLSSLASSNILTGTVKDADNGEALAGATVQLEGTKSGDYCDNEGQFRIESLKKQEYNLLVSMVGYKTRKTKIDLALQDSIYLELKLDKKYWQTSEVIVSANKRVQAVQDVPISVSTISSEDLQLRAMNNLEYALQYVPGVQVTRDNVSIRGSSGFSYGVGSRVLLMLDGFPYLAGDNGDIKFDALPLFNVEQIEIVKGSGSALYGTSAIGGVINVITQDIPIGFQTKFRTYSGAYAQINYDEWSPGDYPRFDNGVDLSISQGYEKLKLLFNIAYVDEESYRVYDKKELINSFFKVLYDLSDNTNISLNGNISISDNDDWAFWQDGQNPFLPAETVDFDNRIDSDKYSLFAGVDHIISSNFFMSTKVGAYFTSYSNRFDVDNPEYRASDAMSFSILPQFNNKIGDDLLLTYGLDIRENIVESVVYGDQNQSIYAGYSQAEYSPWSIIDFTFGLRYDYEKTDNSESNSQVSPKVGVSLELSDGLNIRSSAGAGFRAPQIAEKFAQINFQGINVLPNPELTPERSESYEIGMSFETNISKSQFLFDIAIFRNNMKDLIEPDIDGLQSSSIQFGNINIARIDGLEFSMKSFLFERFGVELSGTVLDPINLATNEVLPFRSKYISQNRLIVPVGDLHFELDYRYFSRMEAIVDELETFGIVNDANIRNSAHIFDGRVRYDLQQALGADLDITLNVFNVLNYYYTQMVGNMGPTRQISLMLSGNFK